MLVARRPIAQIAILLGACGGGSESPKLDATTTSPKHDASVVPDTPPGPGDELFPYSHTIVIDGTDDFQAGEVIPTTSTGYSARVSFDFQNLYLGYAGADLDTSTADASTKWLFAYLDSDNNPSTGAQQSLPYNTQHAVFNGVLGAEYYVRWKCDGTFTSLEMWDGSSWVTSSVAPNAAHGGQFVEMSIPWSAFGSSVGKIRLTTWMINEANLVESSYAGMWTDNFTDGYHEELPITRGLGVDRSDPQNPNTNAI